MAYNKLTQEEKRVIEEKGTEMPFTGEYDDFSLTVHLSAAGAIIPCIVPKQNLMLSAAGRHLMIRSQMLSKQYLTQMVSVLKSSVPTAAHI